MTGEQLIVVGLVASVITFALKYLAIWANYHPSRIVVNIALYVVSGVLAVVWGNVALPVPPVFAGDPVQFAADVLAYASNILAVAAPVVGLATLIYNVLYEKVVVPTGNFLRRKMRK